MAQAARSHSSSQAPFHADALRRFPVFESLSEGELGQLAEKAAFERLPAGRVLLTQNTAAQAVYLLLDGCVAIEINEQVVARSSTQECFGEISCLLPESSATATVRTDKECELIRFDAETFRQLVNEIPSLWRQLYTQMYYRLRETNLRLSEVFSHTPQGYIKVNREGRITHEYSLISKKLLDQDEIEGKFFESVAFRSYPKTQATWSELFPLLFESGGSLFRSTVQILPTEVHLPHDRICRLTYYPCKDLSGLITAVDVGIEDVTRARQLEGTQRKLEQDQEQRRRLFENPSGYQHLLTLLGDTLQKLEPLLDDPEQYLSDSKRLLHDLKGMAGLFHDDVLSEQVDTLEDLLGVISSEMGETPTLSKRWSNQLSTEVEKLKELRAQCHSRLHSLDPDLQRRLTGVCLSQKEYERLIQLAEKTKSEELVSFSRSFGQIPFRKLAHNWPEETQRLCDQLDKEVQFQLIDNNVNLSPSLFESLNACLIHLLRNAIDHGIESALDRIEAGKPAEGTVTLEVTTLEEERLRIVLRDDGQGIDTKALQSKAISNGLITKEQYSEWVKEGQDWKLLFLPELSTRSTVNDISGRGIGMDSVKEQIEALGGSIEVHSQRGKGTEFQIELPTRLAD